MICDVGRQHHAVHQRGLMGSAVIVMEGAVRDSSRRNGFIYLFVGFIVRPGVIYLPNPVTDDDRCFTICFVDMVG